MQLGQTKMWLNWVSLSLSILVGLITLVVYFKKDPLRCLIGMAASNWFFIMFGFPKYQWNIIRERRDARIVVQSEKNKEEEDLEEEILRMFIPFWMGILVFGLLVFRQREPPIGRSVLFLKRNLAAQSPKKRRRTLSLKFWIILTIAKIAIRVIRTKKPIKEASKMDWTCTNGHPGNPDTANFCGVCGVSRITVLGTPEERILALEKEVEDLKRIKGSKIDLWEDLKIWLKTH